MPDELQDVDLAGDALDVRHIDDALFLEDLYGDSFLSKRAGAHLYLAERPLSDGLADDVVADLAGLSRCPYLYIGLS